MSRPYRTLQPELGSREIVELMIVIGTYLMLARMMTVLEIKVDAPIGNTVVDLSRTQPAQPRDARPAGRANNS